MSSNNYPVPTEFHPEDHNHPYFQDDGWGNLLATTRFRVTASGVAHYNEVRYFERDPNVQVWLDMLFTECPMSKARYVAKTNKAYWDRIKGKGYRHSIYDNHEAEYFASVMLARGYSEIVADNYP